MSEQLTDEDLGLSSGFGNLTDADLGLDKPALPRFAMQEAANSIPLPGYTTPFGQDIERTARAMVQSRPSEQALEAGSFQNQRTLEPPPMPDGLVESGNFEGFGSMGNVDPALYRDTLRESVKQLTPSPKTVRSAREYTSLLGALVHPENPNSVDEALNRLAGPDLPPEDFDKAVAGGLGATYRQVESFLQPEQLPLLLAGSVPGKLGMAVTAAFYADMVRHSPEVFNKVVDALESGDPQREAEALTDAVVHGAFLGLTGKHTADSIRQGVDSFIQSNGPEARRRYYEQAEKSQQAADLAPLPQPKAFGVSTPEEAPSPTTSVEASAPRDEIPRAEGDLGRPVPKTEEEIQHALSVRSPETLPVGEASQNSGEVGTGVPTPEESTRAQGGTADQPSAQPAETAPGEISLRPAIRSGGTIVEGALGKSHADLITDATKSGDPVKIMAAIAGSSEGRGFVDQDGKFYTRKEAEALLREQHGDFDLIKPSEGLHSEDLNSEGQPKTLRKAGAPERPRDDIYPLSEFKGELPVSAPHFPVLIERADGSRYEAYLNGYYNMPGTPFDGVPSIGKVKPSGPTGELSLSHGILDPGERIVGGDYPKNAAEYKAAKESGVQPPRTLGETKSAPALAPRMAEAVPAYEHGHAVAFSVPGLLMDPFGFQSARMVGKAIKDIYDSPAVKKARQGVADLWNAAALKSAPKLTRSSRPLGEAGVRYASSHMVGRTKGQIFADKVLADSGIDPVKFGTALAEDNLRSIRAARDPAEAAKVRTLVGDETSPFKTEAEYQAFLKDPATQKAIERHQQLWAEQKDPLYRQANDLDPHMPLATRGLQTGARINLKALQPDEAGVAPIGRRAPGFQQLATLRRRDPFGRQAKGSGLAYEGNYHEIMAHGFERELPVAAQHEFLKQLIEHGDAVVTDKMVEPGLELKGEATARGYLLSLKPYTGKFIHIRKGLADEFESISGLDKPLKLPIITAFNNFMTRQSVAGLAEGATHASNLMTQIFTMPGPTANPMLNALLKSMGRADLLVSLPKVLIKSFTNQRERMLGLAEIGAAKEPYPGAIAKKILNPIDQGVRLVSDDVFKALAKKGLVENTETNRREFINQVGQYNKRLQPLLTRRLRESGLQPFVTAGQTFNAQGLRRLAMAPGVKATSNIRALALRADVAAGWMGGIVLVTALNLLLSKKATGPVGTPLGSVGWVGDDRKVHTFNVFRLLGYERGARITGLGPYVEAKRQGLSPGQALTAGAQSVASTGLGMVMGPGPRFATIAATGQRPTQPWIKEASRVAPSDSLSPLKSQMARNIQTAVIEANPVLSSAAEVRKEMKQGKPVGEALAGGAQKQITRYSPQTRMSEQKAAALPKIVDSVQLREYVDDVAKEARQLPLRERQHFINQRFRDDELGRKYRESAWQQIERKGVLKYR